MECLQALFKKYKFFCTPTVIKLIPKQCVIPTKSIIKKSLNIYDLVRFRLGWNLVININSNDQKSEGDDQSGIVAGRIWILDITKTIQCIYIYIVGAQSPIRWFQLKRWVCDCKPTNYSHCSYLYKCVH